MNVLRIWSLKPPLIIEYIDIKIVELYWITNLATASAARPQLDMEPGPLHCHSWDTETGAAVCCSENLSSSTPAHHGHSALPLQWNLLKEVNYFPPDSRRCAWQRGPAAWSGQHQHLINLRYFQFSVLIDQINKLCFLGWPQWPGLTRSAHWSCNDWRCISPSPRQSGGEGSGLMLINNSTNSKNN